MEEEEGPPAPPTAATTPSLPVVTSPAPLPPPPATALQKMGASRHDFAHQIAEMHDRPRSPRRLPVGAPQAAGHRVGPLQQRREATEAAAAEAEVVHADDADSFSTRTTK